MLRSFPSIVAAGFVSMGTMFLIGTVYLGAGEDDLGLGISIARAAPSRELPPDVASMEAAERLLKQSGVQGGFVVHLGCGDGRLTAWLGAKQEYTVQGLDADPAKVADAREHIGEVRGYGRVSAEELRGTKLPYADNLINLVVVDDPCGVASQEIDRVLAPGGVVMTRTGSASTKRVKPRAGDIDEWTHYLHDATGNPVASDDRVGPPRALQWVAPPLWLRSHETPSGFEALVSAGGRVFYIFDEGVIGITDQRLPERWSLVCRDAFNGKLLWKVPLKQWGWPQWAAEKFADKDWTVIRGARTVVPEENQRRLVAHGDRLYATLSYVAPLSILDAATGEVRATVDATGPVREILAADGVVLTLARTESSSDTSADTAETAADDETGKGKRERKTRAKAKAESPRGTSLLTAVDGATTKVLWQRAVSPVASLMLSIEDGRVIYQSGNTLAALTLNDGKPLWEVKAEGKGRTLLGHAGRIFL
ncbi:MAG: PQQ-binding-like beta-propeller repeat protein, partial [Planctomycetota bacterium]